MEKQKEQLCWSCKNACGGCEWSAYLEPVSRLDGGKSAEMGVYRHERKQTPGLFVQNHRVPEV